MIIIIFFFFFLCQNVTIKEVLITLTERLRTTLLTTVIVTEESDLVGFVSRGQPAQECQLHVHRKEDVALRQPPG